MQKVIIIIIALKEAQRIPLKWQIDICSVLYFMSYSVLIIKGVTTVASD